MARGNHGGIRSLLTLVDEHQEAIEYDLIALGLRLRDLGSAGFTLRDLWVIVQQSPASSALARSSDVDAGWTLEAMLLAEVADVARDDWWATHNGREQDRPKPIERPGRRPDTTVYGSGALPIEEMASWLGWDGPSMN